MKTNHISLLSPNDLFIDEKVWELAETNRDLEQIGSHRIQRIRVRRGDQLEDFEKDMGPSELWPHEQIHFFAGFEYSVGEAMEIAQMLRESKAPMQRGPRDLFGDWLKFCGEKQQQVAHRTVVGPLVTIQRN